MSASRSSLVSAAATFLASTAVMALESEFAAWATNLLRAFTSGELDAHSLRAAFGAGERSTAPRPVTKGLAVLELSGVLMPSESIFSLLGLGTSTRTFMRQLAVAGMDPSVKAIAVTVDSPGGSVRMLPETSTLMRQVRGRKPITVAVTGVAASAAYWIASGATSIEATPSGQVGAIGVVTSRLDVSEQLKKEGVALHVIAAGKHKAESHPALPMSAAERAHIQGQVDAAYTDFVNDIAAGRHTAVATVRGGYGEGRLVTAKNAVALGMIDRIATVEDTLARAAMAPADQMATMAMHRNELMQAGHTGVDVHADLAELRRALLAAGR